LQRSVGREKALKIHLLWNGAPQIASNKSQMPYCTWAAYWAGVLDDRNREDGNQSISNEYADRFNGSQTSETSVGGSDSVLSNRFSELIGTSLKTLRQSRYCSRFLAMVTDFTKL
jgi:hypothetical protein